MATTKTKPIGQRLKEARKGKGDSYRRAALAIGCSDKVVPQWEIGLYVPEKKWWPGIATYTGMPLLELRVLMGDLTQEEADVLADVFGPDGVPLSSGASGRYLTSVAA